MAHLFIPYIWDPETNELLNEREIILTGTISFSELQRRKEQYKELRKQGGLPAITTQTKPTIGGIPVEYKDVRRLFMEAYQKETQKEQPVKTLGLTSMAKALTSGPVDKEEKQRRQEICQECQEQDEGGIHLYLEIDGKSYCGEPRLKRILRDETRNGCGCNLRFKWIFKEAHCPLKKW